MSADGEPRVLVCWGCGEFGQHGHGQVGDVRCQDGLLPLDFDGGGDARVKAVACGSSHTVIVTGQYSWEGIHGTCL